MTLPRPLGCLVLTLVTFVGVAHAQPTTDTPKYIEMVTDDDSSTDASRMTALLTAMRIAPTARDLHWIATTPLSGPLNAMVVLFEYPDLASVERGHDVRQTVLRALPAASRPRLASRIWQFSPDQAFGDGLVPWSAAKAFTLLFVKNSGGGTDEYAEQQQLAAQLLTKANVKDEEWLGYSLRFGPDYPGWVFIDPLPDVSTLDTSHPHAEVLPPSVDRNRDAVLRESVIGGSWSLVVVHPELGSPTH